MEGVRLHRFESEKRRIALGTSETFESPSSRISKAFQLEGSVLSSSAMLVCLKQSQWSEWKIDTYKIVGWGGSKWYVELVPIWTLNSRNNTNQLVGPSTVFFGLRRLLVVEKRIRDLLLRSNESRNSCPDLGWSRVSSHSQQIVHE